MKTQSLLLALAAAPSALAHTVFTRFYVDGVDQGLGTAMRMRKDPQTAGSPIEDLASTDMACNKDSTKGVSLVQSVKDGSTLTFEFRSWPDDPTKESLDRGHKGPCAVYLKKVDSAINDEGAGDGWFKIWDDGYNADSKQWCTDKMIDNDGRMSVVLPKGLKGGYYLARPEILALHNAVKGDPQFYAGCAQIFVNGGGNLAPESTVSIPGYVKAGEESVSFDIYNRDAKDYPVPGPQVAKLSSSSQAAASEQAQTKQSEGLRPAGCIVQNGDWCAKEVPSYSDEKGCWAANQDCWNQSQNCWNTAGPTGGAGCKIMETKCKGIENACNAGNFNGPPNKGKDLNPPVSTIEVGLVMPTSGVAGGQPSTPKTSADAQKPAASQATSYGGGNAVTEETPKPKVVSVPASKPAVTEKPAQSTCPAGYHCEYSTTTIVKTEVEYVTMSADKKRRGLHARRV